MCGVGVGVVRRAAGRRWSVVGVCVAVLCLLPVAVAVWPGTLAAPVDPVALRDRILASADRPYEGYVDVVGRLGVPNLPGFEPVTGLLRGSTRVRAWYASPRAWRVAELAATGERDTYRTAAGTYHWDFELNLVTYLEGESAIWLPGPADLVPPALARRLLGGDGRFTALGTRRVAGVSAAGLRLTPADGDTTVGRVDVWADPVTGLPVRVEVAATGAADASFVSRFLEVRQVAPGPAVLSPSVPSGAGLAVTTVDDVTGGLAAALSGSLPGALAGHRRAAAASTEEISGAAGYGSGFSTFVVLALPGRFGGRTLATARDAGATPVEIERAQAYEMRSPLLTALVVRTEGDRATRRGWLLAGLVRPELLRRAAVELVGTP